MQVSGDARKLDRGEVHLWVRIFDAPLGPGEESAALETLDRPERETLERLRHPGRRAEYLRGRSLVRRTLSRYAEVPPEAWRFQLGSHGRPELAPDSPGPRLGFNLSHTEGCMVCLVSQDPEAGVDVEWTARPGKTVELADRFFCSQEVSDLQELPEEERREQFFRYWTLKESYMKATGLGMSLPLDQFGFRVRGESVEGISFGPRIRDEPSEWSFTTLRLGPEHRAAAGVRAPSDREPRFRWFLPDDPAWGEEAGPGRWALRG